MSSSLYLYPPITHFVQPVSASSVALSITPAAERAHSRLPQSPASRPPTRSLVSLSVLPCAACPALQLRDAESATGAARLIRQPVTCSTSPSPEFVTRHPVSSLQLARWIHSDVRSIHLTTPPPAHSHARRRNSVLAHSLTQHDADSLSVSSPHHFLIAGVRSAPHPLRSTGYSVGDSSGCSSWARRAIGTVPLQHTLADVSGITAKRCNRNCSHSHPPTAARRCARMTCTVRRVMHCART